MCFSNSLKNWVGVGFDFGPSQLIKVIADRTLCTELSSNSNEFKSIKCWGAFLQENNVLGLICSTSQSKEGFELESKIRKAAFELKIPIICIEDFPGNYREVLDAPTNLLVVENKFSVEIYKKQLSILPPLFELASIRYDDLRCAGFHIGNKIMSGQSRILWAGQPEFEYNIKTLQTIVPKLKELSVTLMFRAHPRDQEYLNGIYHRYFQSAGISWVDVTNNKINAHFFKDISLVVTQFSSLAIEAGFYGVPTLNVLLKDIGESLLIERTGSSMLMAIYYDAAFVIRHKEGINEIERYLMDFKLREKILYNFANLYRVNEKQFPHVMGKIQGII